IVALALISIILSSSSFSVADGYTIWVEVNDIKSAKQDFKNESKFYNINLVDNVRASLTNNKILDHSSYEIKLFDAVSILLHDNDQVDQIKENSESKNISIDLSDGIQTDTTNFNNDDNKIILIKQNNDKKALWERIFPLDRIRNISKSFFKIIQNDYISSYVQLSEISINNDENSLEQATIYGSELENLSEFEKFIGKSGYVYNQIAIRASDLLDVEKFVGKSNFVGIQLAIHAQHLADPEKFVGKSMFVGQQITIQVYHIVDPHNPTLLVLLIPMVGLVLIRNENDRIKFYNIQKFVSLIFAIILISSTIITPFSYSMFYWGKAFAEEDSTGDIGPPEGSAEEPMVDQLVQTVGDSVEEIVESSPLEKPVTPAEESVLPLESEPVTEPVAEQNNIVISARNDLTTTFDENIILNDDSSDKLEQHIETQQTGNNQTISLDEIFNITDIISSYYNETESPENNLSITLDETVVLTDEITSPNIPQNQSLPENLSFIDDIILSLQNQTSSLPNATQSWQFENDTSGVTFNDDATIDHTEGINGTSLLLDGQLDYAQANGTNATTYITDMSIAAWVKPNYTNGSPEFTVVSKGKSFVLSINNILEPQHIAKFSIFDGIKWTTVESRSTIPDDSWSYLTARFNKTSIALYVNGTLEGTVTHGGVPYVTEKGQIALKTLQEITSYRDIVIGASLTPNMESSAFNMFSGMIDGVQLFDSRLEPEDIILLYQTTVPIKAPIIPPEIRRPEPVLRYRVIKGNETLPVSIPVEDLDDGINQLTISTWIKPNFTEGSPEFTVLSRENSFILSLNKMELPERVAKFSVYDGIMWHTVTGSTPIDGWAQVAAVVNGSRISIYVNGTLDGKLETGPPEIAASTANVIIGAYENTLRGNVEWSNLF
ncbi:MAG: LamG-like jellyroll fold domain-containing protein, partial [Nitrosopumilaceae archaeon]